MCVYIVLMHREKESLSGQRLSKDHSWRIAEINWVLGQKACLKKIIKKNSNTPYCSGGFQETFSWLIQKQTRAYSVVRHDWNFKWHWLLWSDETKKAFWQQTHQMGLVQTGIKSNPYPRACISAGGPGHLVQMHGIMDSIKYQQIKNLNLTDSVRNLIMGRGWIFHQDNNPKQTSKSTQKWVTEHKMKLLPCRPSPIENEWGELKRRSTNMELWIWRIWRDMIEWSLISYQVFSKLFSHYRRKLRAVILGKGRCKNWGPVIVANMN